VSVYAKKPFELALIAFQNILASITYSLPCLSVHVKPIGWQPDEATIIIIVVTRVDTPIHVVAGFRARDGVVVARR
jgi:hypothetical protein